MCGICGLAYAATPSEAESRVRKMAAAMVHRGPDEDGFLVNDPRSAGTALGMRRLSIIDLSGGHQPVWNEAHDVAVVFNGELYNYRELRERLSQAGHRFSTHGDTEILVHGWEEWGEDLLNELRGMFAFALLDLRKRFATVPVLFLARDPLGIKPLYYTQTAKGFAFASELRALLASEVVERKLSADALTCYLLFGSVSEPVTLVEEVFSLPPAMPCCCICRTAGAPRGPAPGGTPGAAQRREIPGGHTTLPAPPGPFGRTSKTRCVPI